MINTNQPRSKARMLGLSLLDPASKADNKIKSAALISRFTIVRAMLSLLLNRLSLGPAPYAWLKARVTSQRKAWAQRVR